MKKTTKNAVILEIKNTIKIYEAKIEAWARVERVYKKDGKSFANIGKNFKNASVYIEKFINEHKYIEVHNYYNDECENGNNYTRFISDKIEIFLNDTAETIEKEIKARIKYFENKVSSLTEQLKNVDFVINFIDAKINEIKNFINENEKILINPETKERNFKTKNSLCYAMLEYLEENTKAYKF